VLIAILLAKLRNIFRVVKKNKELLFDYSEDGGSKLLQNVGHKLPINTPS